MKNASDTLDAIVDALDRYRAGNANRRLTLIAIQAAIEDSEWALGPCSHDFTKNRNRGNARQRCDRCAECAPSILVPNLARAPRTVVLDVRTSSEPSMRCESDGDPCTEHVSVQIVMTINGETHDDRSYACHECIDAVIAQTIARECAPHDTIIIVDAEAANERARALAPALRPQTTVVDTLATNQLLVTGDKS